MALDQESTNAQLALLAGHRRTLGLLLQQQVKLGAYTPPHVLIDIQENQSAIRRIKEQLRADSVLVDDEPNDDFQPIVVAAPSQICTQERRNRRAMLARVKNIWIDGLLEQSLDKELRIVLNLTERHDVVELPLNALVQELKHSPRLLTAGTPIIEVFDQMGGALLILGAPGAGKTTLLLELTRDLIARAEQDEGYAIPVVFNLSSWVDKRRPLQEWLVEELNTKYDVPRKLAQAWIEAATVLPLLDGLDEVPVQHRTICVEAINRYRQEEQGLMPLAVCSRVADYLSMTAQLRLRGAVLVEPLTQQQINSYLERVGDKLVGVQAAVRADADLGEMLNTPLMLSIVTVAYAGKSAADIQAVQTPDRQRQHLFDAYILAMFQRRHKDERYSQQSALRYLSWIAHKMIQQSQTVFFMEQLQPGWLPTRISRFQYVLLDRLAGGLVFGLVFGLIEVLINWLIGVLLSGLVNLSEARLDKSLASGLLFGLIYGLVALFFGGQQGYETPQQHFVKQTTINNALVGGLVGGLVSGIGGRLIGALIGELPILGGWFTFGVWGGLLGGMLGILNGKPGIFLRQVKVVERLNWIWGKAWSSAESGQIVGLMIGLVIGLVTLQTSERDLPLQVLLHMIVVNGLVNGILFAWCGGLLGGIVGGFSSGTLTATTQVNQGIRRSSRSALIGGLAGLLVGGLAGGLGGGLSGGLIFWSQGGSMRLQELLYGILGFGQSAGVVGGLIGGLSFGGYACLSHIALRLILSCSDSLPLHLVSFLDYCVERIFLRRIGGGYIFVHRLLMEHFASLYTEVPESRRRM